VPLGQTEGHSADSRRDASRLCRAIVAPNAMAGEQPRNA